MERSFALAADDEAFIDNAVSAGRFETANDVVRAGIELLREREALAARFEAEIQKGIDAADRGELVDAEEVFDRLERKYRDMAEQRKRVA